MGTRTTKKGLYHRENGAWCCCFKRHGNQGGFDGPSRSSGKKLVNTREQAKHYITVDLARPEAQATTRKKVDAGNMPSPWDMNQELSGFHQYAIIRPRASHLVQRLL